MQACLARLYVDEPFRKLFYLEPAGTLQEYRLTREESAAIQSLDHRMLDVFESSLKNKRKKRIQRAYPMLFSLDTGSRIDSYYLRYYHLYRARPNQSGYQDVMEFGLFME